MCMSDLPACICTACVPREIRRGYEYPELVIWNTVGHQRGSQIL